MAIIKGFTATINCNQKQLPEYRSAGESRKTSTVNYIAATPGDSYSIVLEGSWPSDDDCEGASVRFYVDGTYLASYTIKGNKRRVVCNGALSQKDGYLFEHPLSFGTIDFMKPPSGAEASKRARCLGDIRVMVVRITNVRNTSATHKTRTPRLLSESVAMPEKMALQSCKSVCTQLGEARRKKFNSVTYDKLDSWKRPYAVFNFMYRSHDDLQRLSLIPQPTLSPPLPANLPPPPAYAGASCTVADDTSSRTWEPMSQEELMRCIEGCFIADQAPPAYAPRPS